MKPSRKRYLQYLNPLELLKTKKVLQSNPTILTTKTATSESQLSLFVYSTDHCQAVTSIDAHSVNRTMFSKEHNYWLNLDIINKQTVELIGEKIGLHNLVIEDILTVHQRPKTDEIDNYLTCVLQMMYYNQELQTIESEQVSLVLGKNFLISFQDDAARDLFNQIRERLKSAGTKIRNSGPDYLLYAMLDAIVDHYFIVLENLGEQIETLEEDITRNIADPYTMNRINNLRKELMYFKRSAVPVREVISNIIRSENENISDSNVKYFKDILDHSTQANELLENYRDMLTNIRDLYLSQVNLKLNEVMKFLAIVTTLLAPATVIGGIFGMNFDRIPYLHHQDGFWIATVLMIVIPILMLMYFRKRGWF
ncbi:MAG: magnesium/cobalt transporter CorA [Chitinophagaceae bacterium]|nr:magnesium/cobalt transporter CorA [Chitinophagaceae bacterium]